MIPASSNNNIKGSGAKKLYHCAKEPNKYITHTRSCEKWKNVYQLIRQFSAYTWVHINKLHVIFHIDYFQYFSFSLKSWSCGAGFSICRITPQLCSTSVVVVRHQVFDPLGLVYHYIYYRYVMYFFIIQQSEHDFVIHGSVLVFFFG